jgi:hypothetical protein
MATYGVESAAELVPARRQRTRRLKRAARSTGPRTFEACWREHPARKGLGVFLLFIPLFLEGFAPGVSPLALVLSLSLIAGIAAGLLFAPDLRRLAVGLVPGLLAGILTPLGLHAYLAFTPREYPITSKELAVVWVMTLVGPAALYCVLLWLSLPRAGHAAGSDSGPEPVTFQGRPTIWGLLIASGFFFLLGAGSWAVMLHEPPIPRKLLFLFMGGVWVALGFLIVAAGLLRGRTGRRRRRGGSGLD